VVGLPKVVQGRTTVGPALLNRVMGHKKRFSL